MEEHVGTLLWEMRTTLGWTLGRLAQRAGISKAALSRWESGLRQPRVTELEGVLMALDASPAQRALVLARIDAPSALRQLRQPTPAYWFTSHYHASDGLSPNGLGAPLSARDLLRAMRWRGGWTQEQIAARLGVTQHTVARWELGERLPDVEQMQSLCYVLGAHEEEMVTLTTGRLREMPIEAQPMDWEEKEADLLQRVEAVNENRVGGLEELHYIQLDREAWQWALREPAARLLLARLRIYHAHYHRLHQRWELSRTLARQAHQSLQAVPKPEMEKDFFVFLRLAILQAAAAVHGGVRPAPEQGVRLLSPWVERSHALPAFQAWILSDIAKYLSMAGNHDEALALAERACRLAQDVHPNELFLRRSDYGRLLLQVGRADEALQVLPEPLISGTGQDAVDVLLLQVEALGKAGRLTEAQGYLNRAHALIEAQNLEPQRQRAVALMQRF